MVVVEIRSGPSRARAKPTERDGSRRGACRLCALIVLATCLLYAPIAMSSMWFAFDPGAPRLQEQLDSLAGGEAYATGPGSVTSVRTADYAAHRWVMLVHTFTGGVALLMAGIQWAGARRFGRRTHRRVGRLYLTLMVVSMGAALMFLVVSPEVPGIGQLAFRWQLWVLALSTLGSGGMAVLCARRGDVVGHRAWMGLNLAFMLTAPVLRLSWLVLAPLFPGHDMLTNLKVGAVALAILAPAAGVLAMMLRSRPPLRARCLERVEHIWSLLLVTAVGCLVVVASLPDELAGAEAYPWFHVVPVTCLAAVSQVGYSRALRTRDLERAHAWRMALLGAAFAPWAAVTLGALVATTIGPVEGYLAGLMVAPGVTIVAAFVAILGRRSPTRLPANRVSGPHHQDDLGLASSARRSRLFAPAGVAVVAGEADHDAVCLAAGEIR